MALVALPLPPVALAPDAPALPAPVEAPPKADDVRPYEAGKSRGELENCPAAWASLAVVAPVDVDVAGASDVAYEAGAAPGKPDAAVALVDGDPAAPKLDWPT